MPNEKRSVGKLKISDSFKQKLEGTLGGKIINKNSIKKKSNTKIIKKNSKNLVISDNTSSIPCTKQIIKSVIPQTSECKNESLKKDNNDNKSIVINNIINYPNKNNFINNLYLLSFIFSIGILFGRFSRRS